MNTPNYKTLSATLLSQLALLGTLSAQTTWDGGGAVNTNINTSANWNNDIANALNGTQAATFGTGGSTATMNVDGYFSTLTFNRDNASGFTVNGPGTLSVALSGSGATANLTVGDTAGNGVTTINAPFKLNTDSGTTRLLVIDNRESGTTGESLVFTGGITATNTSNAYGLRFGGSGSTRIAGSLGGTLTSNIQQASITSNNMAGTVTIAGNQSLGSAQVNIAGNGGSVNGNVASTAKFVMGDGTSDVQSWASTSVNQAGTVEIKSTATLSGAVSLSNAASNGSSGGTLDVSGSLTAGALNIGGAVYSGILKVSGAANFTGAVTTGATSGSKIVGGGASNGILTLSSGTVGSAVAIGGGGTNENNLALVKDTTGVLTISSANNTYSGGTTLVNGGASGAAGLVLGANNALGTGPLVIGTSATSGNGARFRMGGFNQTVSALSSGSVGTRVIENFGATDSTLTVNQSTDTTYSGFLRDRTASGTTVTTGGKLGLVKDGSGTLTLSNQSNQYTGATVINGGVLEVAQLTNGGIEKTITTTSGSGTVTMADTTGITAGMAFSAPTLPTGFAVSTVDSGTAITVNTTGGTTGTGTAYFGNASSIGLSTNAASNLVFGGGTLRYTGATNAFTDRNFTINSGQSAKWDVSNAAATLTLTGGAAASTGGFQKLGDGVIVLSGAQAYTGDTAVTAGVLALGAADRISDSSRLVLGGGTFDVNGFSETFGSLDLNADAIIDLDNIVNASGTISFAASNLESWSTFGLSITGTAFGATSVRFGTDANGLTAGQLANITVNGLGGWGLDGGGYLVSTIPEPSSFAVIAGLAALAGTGLRRRRRA